MAETTVNDPVFGRLIWDGFQHEGWGGSFVDAQWLSWGSAIDAALPDYDEDEDDGPAPKTTAQDFLSELLSAADGKMEGDADAMKMIRAAQDFAKRVDAYDGSLDAEPLRKAGRLKVVVRNPRETKPTAAQQVAWQAFRARGDAITEEIATALLATYRQQRPERVRWWNVVYGDSPDATLPQVSTTQAMRAIVRPKEFRVYAEHKGTATVAVVLESFWCDKDIKVSVRDGKVTRVGPVESSRGISTTPPPEEIESPVFGRLRRGRTGGWHGVFHSDQLRGWDDASQTRYRFKESPSIYVSPWRPGPGWETITGDFDLHIDTKKDHLPSPAQEEAFKRFNADPKAAAHLVFSAILLWYRRIRPNWVEQMNGSQESIESVVPDVRSPEGLLEIVELQSVTIMPEASVEESAGLLQIEVPFGPKAGKQITLPAKKPGVAIFLSFHWEDEHGLGVRWRDGQIEKVGDWESAADESE
jgi:hypothetical protein